MTQDRPALWRDRPFIIAEISANHLGSLDRAFELIDAAKHAGADAVKFQAYHPDTITVDCEDPAFVISDPMWKGRTLYDLYTEAQTPFTWFPKLWEKAASVGILPFASVFDETALSMLEDLDSALYKIASCELVDIPLIEKVAETGKPIVLSTGMASLDEIIDAANAAFAVGKENTALLHCVSGYPTPNKDANLLTIPDLAAKVGCTVGFSDHTTGIDAATAAIALGAMVVEKHITLRRSDGGPDAAFSLEPNEFKTLVSSAKAAFAARGKVFYGVKESEEHTLSFRRSLYTVASIAKGERLSTMNIRSIRPAGGLPPKELPRIVGRAAARDLPVHHPLSWDDIEL